MRRAAAVILLFLSTTAFAADAADEVRQAESAFAKAFADRDRDRFFAFVAEDAHFLGRRRTMSGKKEVVEVWSAYFEPATAPFSWKPERVVANAAGNLGVSSGPVFDPAGAQIGTFTSTWQKQPDGAWKILFDGGSPCPPPAAAAVEEGVIDGADGVRLHYSKSGSGRTVLIVPGEMFLFDDFKQLANQATVIAYDMRNRGRSDRTSLDKVSIQADVRDLEAVRRHFNADRFVPAGFSYLGLMVAMYTLDHPERVERMIQMGPVSMVAGTQYPKELTHGHEDVAASDADVKRWREMQASGAVTSSPREFCEVDWRVMQFVLVGDAANAAKVKSHCDLETEWPANLRPHFERSFASIKSLTLTKDDFRRIVTPVLTIHGTFDRNAPYGGGREWAATLPNARLLTIPGAAHEAWIDAPDVVFPAIRQFLRGEWPRGAEKPQ
jgi:pimeloyl-ACP methyl ester carboxylesterase/ketosteroid isomerase-like protein